MCDRINTMIPYGPDGKPWEETVSPLAKFQGAYLVSPPSVDPASLYDFKEEPVTSAWYQVPSTGLTKEQRTRAFDETEKVIRFSESVLLGHRCSLRNSLECVSDPLMSGHLNNGGSAFAASHSGLSTLWMERNVLDYYASLWHAKWPHNPKDPKSYWGYTLTMGSTEGNLHALWNARNYLSGKYSGEDSEGSLSSYHYSQCIPPDDNPNAFSPVVFYSHDVHYSFMKATEALMIPSFYETGTQKYPKECPLGGAWSLAVPCEGGDGGSGAIDIEALKTLVDFFSAKGHPIIIIFSYGTTSKGAYDDVKAAGEALIPILKKNGMYERKHYYLEESINPNAYIIRKGFWFHVDGAMGAAYAPFLQMAYKNSLTELTPPPVFDFQLDFISSVVTSGHKFIGIPWPCGVYISKTEFQLRSPKKAHIPFFESPDLTLAGSRNAHSALALWSYISTYSYEEQARRAIEALKTAVYAEQKLKELEADIKQDLWIMHSPASLAVGFKRPNARILGKYRIAGHSLLVDGERRQYVYIYTVDGEIKKQKIDELIEDLHSPDAFNFN